MTEPREARTASPRRTAGKGERGLLARRSAFNFVGLATATGLQFLMLLVLARALGNSDAGVFFEGFAAVPLLPAVASIGLDVTLVRYVAVHRARGEEGQARSAVRLAVALSLAASLAATVVVFAASPLIAAAY